MTASLSTGTEVARPFLPAKDFGLSHAAIVETERHGSAYDLEHVVRTNWLNAAQRLGPLIDRFDG